MDTKEIENTVNSHSFEDVTDSEIIVALTGELGELANNLKKEDFYNKIPGYKKRVDREIKNGDRETFNDMIKDETGDVLFYFVKFLTKRGLTLNDVFSHQLDKLKAQTAVLNISKNSNDKIFKK